MLQKLPCVVSANEADVAQLVRAPGCGSGGRGFNSHHSPHENENSPKGTVFIFIAMTAYVARQWFKNVSLYVVISFPVCYNLFQIIKPWR